MSEHALPDSQTVPPAQRRHNGGRGAWMSDFQVRGGRVEVFDTGADLRLDGTLLGEIAVWLGYHAVVRLRSWWLRLVAAEAPRIWFTPVPPRPWYLVWSAAAWAGVRIARSPGEADAAFAFEDATWTVHHRRPALGLPCFNFDCVDVSKTHVAEVFEQVFGYALAVNPAACTGVAVEKGELNGAHDGSLIVCPTARMPGRCYQRLVDTSDGAFTYDLRTACIGGHPVAVWIKRKPVGERFSIHNLGVTLHRPQDVFSPTELEQIAAFLSAMRADWAGLDILRDRADGRIYIVDVNKTDVGPIIALPFRDKLRSTRLLAAALRTMLDGTAPGA